jgi:hypothetical protein
MRRALKLTFFVIAVMLTTSALSSAQTSDPPAVSDAALAPGLFGPSLGSFDADALVEQAAGPPPAPRHTGIETLTEHLVTNFKYLLAKENVIWGCWRRTRARRSPARRQPQRGVRQ